MSSVYSIHSSALALLLAVAACRGGSSERGEPTKAAADTQVRAGGMAGMAMPSGKDSASAPGTEVTLTAAQIRHGGVAWQSVTIGTASATVPVPGQLVPNEDRSARLGAPASGRVVAVPVRPGDQVARGRMLVTLHSPEAGAAQSDLAKAQAELASRRAQATYDSLFPNTNQRFARRVELLYATRQFDSAAAVIDRQLASGRLESLGRAFNLDGRSRIFRTRGRLADARRDARTSATLQAQEGRPQARLEEAIDATAEAALVLEDRARAASILNAALVETPLESVPPAARPYAGLAFAAAIAGQTARAEALLTSFEAGRKGIVGYEDDLTRTELRGAIAFAGGKYDEAARHFRAASEVGDCMTCDLSLLAVAYDRAGMADSAIVTYERYLKSPDHLRFVVDPVLLAPAHRRLGELYEAKGDVVRAHEHYAAFVDLWKNADPELQPKVAAVRRRMARLRDTER